jgi:hypothetical protein
MQQRTLFVRFDCWPDVIATTIRDVIIDQDLVGNVTPIPVERSFNLDARCSAGRSSDHAGLSDPGNKPCPPMLSGDKTQ